MGLFLEKLFAPLQTTKNAPDSPLFWRIIPDDTSIPSPAVSALSGRGYTELRLYGVLGSSL
jgi:hypothetical protein